MGGLLRTRDGQTTGLRDGQSLLQHRTGRQTGGETKRERGWRKKETEDHLIVGIIRISDGGNATLDPTTQTNVAVKE